MSHPVRYDGPKILHHMTSTTFELKGFQVMQTLGVVMGITVRSRSVVGLIGAGIETFFGGRITAFVSLCEKARQEAFELMLEHAEQTGGNAVIGIRYDANEVMRGVTEVLCYGTAVVVEPGPSE
ncbi:MAG TPA: YbjQ family protein [Gemmatimonadales bacterium]|nr:YbjQ family protein [Gemmatimonadales bacterium]